MPVAWFAIAVVVAVAAAGIASALVLSRPVSTALGPLSPGVARVLVNAQGWAASGEYSVTFNVTSSSGPMSNSRVGADILINLTCRSSSSPNGPFCDYFLFACPCCVQYVNYTWPEVAIIHTYATNTTALTPGGYQFGIRDFNGRAPAAVLSLGMTAWWSSLSSLDRRAGPSESRSVRRLNERFDS